MEKEVSEYRKRVARGKGRESILIGMEIHDMLKELKYEKNAITRFSHPLSEFDCYAKGLGVGKYDRLKWLIANGHCASDGKHGFVFTNKERRPWGVLRYYPGGALDR